jgi:hypothetical protein
MEWKNTVITQDQEIQKHAFVGKVTLTLSSEFNGPILQHYQNRGQTISNARYCAMFEEGFKPPFDANAREC